MESMNGKSLVEGTVFVDTETTGLGDSAEVLELCVLDDEGNALFNERFAPEKATEWPIAQEVHGISPEDVEGLPTLAERAGEVQALLDSAARICIYNARYDIPIMANGGVFVEEGKACDTMLEFAEIQKVPNRRRGGWKWFTLAKAAAKCGYDGEPDHSAMGDCLATRWVQAWCDRANAGDAA